MNIMIKKIKKTLLFCCVIFFSPFNNKMNIYKALVHIA